MVSALVFKVDWVEVRNIALCSCARHLTFTVSFSTQVYKWVPASRITPSRFNELLNFI